jgi:hypothetical protein
VDAESNVILSLAGQLHAASFDSSFTCDPP